MTGAVRIQLRRTKGFRLQPYSMALNSLPAVKVDRTTKWGNIFIPGQENPFLPGSLVADKRHAFVLYRAHAPLNRQLVAAARAELQGYNLACWCDKDVAHEDECHGAILIELANAPKVRA